MGSLSRNKPGKLFDAQLNFVEGPQYLPTFTLQVFWKMLWQQFVEITVPDYTKLFCQK